MQQIKIKLEKVLDILVRNAEIPDDLGAVVINRFNRIMYSHTGSDRLYPNCHVLGPECFINCDATTMLEKESIEEWKQMARSKMKYII